MYRRRNRFGRTPRQKSGVSRSNITARKRGKCKACAGYFQQGDTIVKLRLKKYLRMPCGGCGKKPIGSKSYHPNCVPADINAAMGYDPTKHQHNTPAASTVAPPPKPPTALDASVAALASLEHALVLKLRDTPKAWTINNGKRALLPEYEKAFNTLQGLKARVLRPGTPEEGEVATSVFLQRIVKLVYA